ncbi:hypothetical protein BRC83_00710 [Halobacteriales archaeon QS_1_68_17]|nr:MAG: hypothetical protein BRC83_00710 [Halobacteriales archaeon QS_1_68_17]
MTDIADLVERSLSPETRPEFDRRVREQARFLREIIDDGTLDNEGFAVGLEIEVYAVDRDDRLATLPDSVFDVAGKELGLHNAELNTDPSRFTPDGIDEQAAAVAAGTERARAAADEAGYDLALDAMWTVPPGEGSERYLSATEDRDGVSVAQNMRPNARYCALDNEAVRLAGGRINFDVPGAAHEFPTILFESLATSIQPHLQIPSVAAFPDYYNAAIRTLGPLTALATNSPLLPPDLYNAVDDPDALLDETHHELRIAAFEQSMNRTANPKVRVPDDLTETADLVDHILDDEVFAPFLSEWANDRKGDGDDDGDGDFADRFPEFDYKRGTYWRWLRPVVGGDPVDGAGDERSLRIEYRPLPTQPTTADTISFLCLTAGVIRGVVVTDHPLTDLPWTAARDSFYRAVADGIEADVDWLTAEGERTADPAVVYEDLFAVARRGLTEQGFSASAAEAALAPARARWEARETPATWKLRGVRRRLDGGASLPAAVTATQREYLRLSRERDSFADWPAPDADT